MLVDLSTLLILQQPCATCTGSYTLMRNTTVWCESCLRKLRAPRDRTVPMHSLSRGRDSPTLDSPFAPIEAVTRAASFHDRWVAWVTPVKREVCVCVPARARGREGGICPRLLRVKVYLMRHGHTETANIHSRSVRLQESAHVMHLLPPLTSDHQAAFTTPRIPFP